MPFPSLNIRKILTLSGRNRLAEPSAATSPAQPLVSESSANRPKISGKPGILIEKILGESGI